MPSTSIKQKAKTGAVIGAITATRFYQKIYNRLPRSIQKDKYVQLSAGLFLSVGLSAGAIYGVFSKDKKSEDQTTSDKKQPNHDRVLYKQNIQQMLTRLENQRDLLSIQRDFVQQAAREAAQLAQEKRQQRSLVQQAAQEAAQFAQEKQQQRRLVQQAAQEAAQLAQEKQQQRRLVQQAAREAAQLALKKQPKREQLQYALSARKINIQSIFTALENHSKNLLKQGASGKLKAEALRLLINDLQLKSKKLDHNIQSFDQFNKSSDALKTEFGRIIEKHLGPENSKLKMHRHWATRIGIFIINALMTITVAPLIAHKAIYQTWLFRPKTTTEVKLEKAAQDLNAITAIKISSPARAG